MDLRLSPVTLTCWAACAFTICFQSGANTETLRNCSRPPYVQGVLQFIQQEGSWVEINATSEEVFSVNTKIVFQCMNAGIDVLVGTPYIVCGYNGIWSGGAPQCHEVGEIIFVEPIDLPRQVNVDGSLTVFLPPVTSKLKVKITCQVLQGSEPVLLFPHIMDEEGRAVAMPERGDHSFPKEILTLSPPNLSDSGNFTCQDMNYGNQRRLGINFEAQSGANTETLRDCSRPPYVQGVLQFIQQEGSWIELSATNEEVFSVNTKIVFQCMNAGIDVLDGTPYIVCGYNGIWSGDAPQCLEVGEIIFVEPIDLPRQVNFDGSLTVFLPPVTSDLKVKITCQVWWGSSEPDLLFPHIMQEERRVDVMPERGDHSFPKKILTLSPPNLSDSGNFTCQEMMYGIQRRLEINFEAQSLANTETLRNCSRPPYVQGVLQFIQQEGSWVELSATSEEVFPVNTKIVFQCMNAGIDVLEGTPYIVCGYNGIWSGDAPQCHELGEIIVVEPIDLPRQVNFDGSLTVFLPPVTSDLNVKITCQVLQGREPDLLFPHIMEEEGRAVAMPERGDHSFPKKILTLSPPHLSDSGNFTCQDMEYGYPHRLEINFEAY